MSDFELDIFHTGVLIGLLVGAVLYVVVQDAVREGQRWHRRLVAERARALRCRKTWECLDENGHDGPCENLKDCD